MHILKKDKTKLKALQSSGTVRFTSFVQLCDFVDDLLVFFQLSNK